MARSPRLEYPGAIYHVINRGNYKRDIFESAGAAQAFVEVIEEAVARYGWELGAYVVMRNHYHLALRTPEPNLSDGMQWLQTTFANRFNRFREVRGHLFQGRFKSILLQNEGVWARVVDYIHLNPLRAGIVEPDFLSKFRWSSLHRLLQGTGFKGFTTEPWLMTMGLESTRSGWETYAKHLLGKFGQEQAIPESERENWSAGWALGDSEWQRSMADKMKQQSEESGAFVGSEPREARELRWAHRLQELMEAEGRKTADLTQKGSNARWKMEIADQHQREMGTSLVWLADKLKINQPGALRTALWRMRKKQM